MKINVIVKTDVQGTAEAIKYMVEKLSNDEFELKVLRAESGEVTETDIYQAQTGVLLIGFKTQPSSRSRALAKQLKVEINIFSVIYEISDFIKKRMQTLKEPVFEEVTQGEAEVLKVFNKTVGGCMVRSGKIVRNSSCRVFRDGKEVFKGKIDTLKRFKDDVKEVAQGFECGLSLAGEELKEKDKIITFIMVQKP
jgi:translation initiation factor IF-2